MRKALFALALIVTIALAVVGGTLFALRTKKAQAQSPTIPTRVVHVNVAPSP